VRAILLTLTLCLAGCHALSETGAKEVEGEVAAHAGYRRLIESTLSGDPTIDQGVVIGEGVSQKDLDETPRPVAVLLRHVIRALYDSGKSWNAVAFDTDLGPDPATLPPIVPPTILQAGWDVAPVSTGH
jgi:hypothetical protein